MLSSEGNDSEDEMTIDTNANSTAQLRHVFRDNLRIELPRLQSSSSMPSSGAVEVRPTSPQTAVYRPDDEPYARIGSIYSPLHTESTIMELSSQKSATALLKADVTSRHLSYLVSGSAMRRKETCCMNTDHQSAPAKKKSSLAVFTNMIRKSLPAQSQPRELSYVPDQASTGDADGDTLKHFGHQASFSNFDLRSTVHTPRTQHPPPDTATVSPDDVAITPSAPPATMPPAPPPTGAAAGVVASPPLSPDTEDSSESSQQTVGMDLVLQEASKVHGIRLSWLLYSIITIVFALFVMLFFLISYSASHALGLSATQSVQSYAASLISTSEMQRGSLEDLFEVLLSYAFWNSTTPLAADDPRKMSICTQMYSAPMAFGVYNAIGEMLWSTRCDPYEATGLPSELPASVLPSIDALHHADAGNYSMYAYRSYVRDGTTQTVLVMLNKALLGRIFLRTDTRQYSSGVLQHIYAGYLAPEWNTSTVVLSFHTLVPGPRDAVDGASREIGTTLMDAFDSYCDISSPYVWHSVARSSSASHISSTESSDLDEGLISVNSPMPQPKLLHGGSWGLVSRAIICGVLCSSDVGDQCREDNPTNVWFVVDYHAYEEARGSEVTVVGVSSIVAVVLFSIIMFIVYISITVPVNYLKFQIMHAVGSHETSSLLQKKIVRWTHQLWLGDLTAIARSVHILSLCFQLNKRYVPEHALRNHANQLYLQRQKFNFLNNIELCDDVERCDSDSEEEVEIISQLMGATTVMHSDSNFLWHFNASAANEESTAATAAATASSAELQRLDSRPLPTSQTLSLHQSMDQVYSGDLTSIHKGFGDSSARLLDASVSLGPVGELDGTLNDHEPSLRMSDLHSRAPQAMFVRQSSDTTILCLRVPHVEVAYQMNYSLAAIQHRRIMKFLLYRIRRRKGMIFHRTGDCLGVIWNAFESCPNHVEYAAVCAQEIANAFGQLRMDGLNVGIVLHQGPIISGTIECSRTAFITVFGEGARQALALADLAVTLSGLNVLITEAVKQALASSYESNIVDVIQLPNLSHPLLLFELCGRRQVSTLPLSSSSPPSPILSPFTVEYAKVFSYFRNHKFTESLQGITELRCNYPNQCEHLLRRLESLSTYFMAHPSVLPCPYYRPYPLWVNYEGLAKAGFLNETQFESSSRSVLLRSQPRGSQVIYDKVPYVLDDNDYIRDFKQELQDNVRRLGTPAQGSPRLSSRKGPSSTVDESSGCPTRSLLPSPALRAASPPPLRLNDGLVWGSSPVLSGDGDEVEDSNGGGSSASDAIELPTPLPTPSHGSSRLRCISLPAATRVRTVVESQSLHDVLAMSQRFSMTHSFTKKPPVALGASPDLEPVPHLLDSVTPGTSVQSSTVAEATSCSFIQSAGMSLQDMAGEARSLYLSQDGLPTEINAKNGTTYMRSTRILGKGSFGSVYLGMDIHSGKLVAIKFLPLPSDEAGMQGIEAEVLIMQRVKDPHVVEFISYAFQEDTIVVVIECMLAGSLQNMISAFHCIPNTTARVFMRDVMRGISKLHSMGVIHRDVKPQNVLLSMSGTCKISDFGASAWLQELARKDSQGQVLGTPVYLAPEAARGNPLKESDIWSCGIMFLQLITGALPYTPEQLSLEAPVLVYQIGCGMVRPHISPLLNELDAAFAKACLQSEPSKRLKADALLQLPLFTV